MLSCIKTNGVQHIDDFQSHPTLLEVRHVKLLTVFIQMIRRGTVNR